MGAAQAHVCVSAGTHAGDRDHDVVCYGATIVVRNFNFASPAVGGAGVGGNANVPTVRDEVRPGSQSGLHLSPLPP